MGRYFGIPTKEFLKIIFLFLFFVGFLNLFSVVSLFGAGPEDGRVCGRILGTPGFASDVLLPQIHSDRTVIKPLTENDIADLQTILADPEVQAFYGKFEAAQLLKRSVVKSERGDGVYLMIRSKENNAPLGLIYFKSVEPQKFGFPSDKKVNQIGYALSTSHRNQGFASEVVGAVVSHLFRAQSNVDVVGARVDAHNAASIRVLEKNGFVPLSFQDESGKLFYGRHRETASP